MNQLKTDLDAVQERVKTQQIDRFLTQFRQQMKQWRIESYTIIDQVFDEKCHDFTRYVDNQLRQQPEEIRRLQDQLDVIGRAENVHPDQLDSLRSRVNDVNQKINQIEQALASVVFTPIKVDPNAVQTPK